MSHSSGSETSERRPNHASNQRSLGEPKKKPPRQYKAEKSLHRFRYYTPQLLGNGIVKGLSDGRVVVRRGLIRSSTPLVKTPTCRSKGRGRTCYQRQTLTLLNNVLLQHASPVIPTLVHILDNFRMRQANVAYGPMFWATNGQPLRLNNVLQAQILPLPNRCGRRTHRGRSRI